MWRIIHIIPHETIVKPAAAPRRLQRLYLGRDNQHWRVVVPDRGAEARPIWGTVFQVCGAECALGHAFVYVSANGWFEIRVGEGNLIAGAVVETGWIVVARTSAGDGRGGEAQEEVAHGRAGEITATVVGSHRLEGDVGSARSEGSAIPGCGVGTIACRCARDSRAIAETTCCGDGEVD